MQLGALFRVGVVSAVLACCRTRPAGTHLRCLGLLPPLPFLVPQVTNAPGARLSSSCFTRYWINYDNGAISLGRGEPGEELCCCWTDPDPIQHIRFAGACALSMCFGCGDREGVGNGRMVLFCKVGWLTHTT